MSKRREGGKKARETNDKGRRRLEGFSTATTCCCLHLELELEQHEAPLTEGTSGAPWSVSLARGSDSAAPSADEVLNASVPLGAPDRCTVRDSHNSLLTLSIGHGFQMSQDRCADGSEDPNEVAERRSEVQYVA